MKAFMGNGYPCSFIHSASAARAPRENDGEREEERPPTVPLSYVADVSEWIRTVCKDCNIKVVFKSRPPSVHSSLRSWTPPHKETSICHLQSTVHLRKGEMKH